MSDLHWSDEQKLAIDSVSSNVLLSAGAGSGKTAVLTERIYQLVKNGADLSRFLILTFTNPASSEMKKRIRERILKDKELGDYSAKVETAHIETFDSFALFIVKKYAFRLGVSPNISILDNTLLDIQRNNIRDNLLTYLYQSKDSAFLRLVFKYCVKNDDYIRAFINKICLKAEMHVDRNDYLDHFVETYFDEKRLNELIDEKYQKMIDAINQTIIRVSYLEDPDDASKIISSLENLLEVGKDFDSLCLAANQYNFPSKSGKSISNAEVRKSIKETLFRVLITEQEYGSREEIIKQYLSTKEDIETLIGIVRKIENELDGFKKAKSSYSFGDIAALALKALDMEDIRKELSEFFRYILVDEYQDTSMLQELVINKLEHNNVCMVGDIKQSIYRFRMADCTLFQHKYSLYKNNEGGKVINLNTSYRSRREIVDIVNEMFSILMTSKTNPIDYSDGHTFGFGLKAYDPLIDNNEDYKLKIYKYPIEKGVSSIKKETNIIARDIINKIYKGYKVFDKETEELRNCSFKDFAIIVDRGTHFNEMKSYLSDYGIPTRVIYNEPVRDSEIITVLKNLLILYNSVINENYDEKYKQAFVSIARSFIGKYTDQEIYEFIRDNKINDSGITKKITSIAQKTKYQSLEFVLNELIDGFEIFQKIDRLKHFSNNANKIELFVNLSRSMDKLGMSLDGLISYFEDLNTFGLEIDYADKDVGEDSVTLITIHRSKGLEYPIVYMPGLTSRFTPKDDTSFLLDEKYGPVLPIVGENAKTSLFNHLIKLDEGRNNFEERLRLFYVAVTRARERLIMLFGEKEKGEEVIIDPVYAVSFKELVHYMSLEYKYGVVPTFEDGVSLNKNSEIEKKHIALKNINVKPTEIEIRKASKEQDGEIDQSLLEFGTEIHYLLEISNYESKDTSFISNPRMRKFVDNVLRARVFENVKNSQVLHEYSFFDEKNNVNGVIDCLVIKDEEIDIIDFKLKNIDDEKYILQLHTYRDYIEQIAKKKIRMFLISAITGEVKEVE